MRGMVKCDVLVLVLCIASRIVLIFFFHRTVPAKKTSFRTLTKQKNHEQALSLFESGHVTFLRKSTDGVSYLTVTNKLDDDDQRFYDVSLNWRDKKSFHTCTCPMYWYDGRECKHILASLLFVCAGIACCSFD
jgi:uncharacterized Zn finger protein